MGSPDHWLNAATGAGGIAACLATIGAGVMAARYGRRASVSISAEAQPTATGFLIVARPSVKAVGVFRVRLRSRADSSRVVVAEVRSSGGRDPVLARVATRSGFFGDVLIDGGEEQITTTLVPVPAPHPSAIGWAVWFQVSARNRFLRLAWVPNLSFIQWLGSRRRIRSLGAHLSSPLRNLLLRPFSDWVWFDQIFVPLVRERVDS